MLFLRGQIDERRNLANIIVLRGKRSKSLSKRRADIVDEASGPSLGCELRPEEASQQRENSVWEAGQGILCPRANEPRKFIQKPLITLLHGLKLHAAWCPLMGKGKQNASRDTLLNIWSIRKSASFIHF